MWRSATKSMHSLASSSTGLFHNIQPSSHPSLSFLGIPSCEGPALFTNRSSYQWMSWNYHKDVELETDWIRLHIWYHLWQLQWPRCQCWPFRAHWISIFIFPCSECATETNAWLASEFGLQFGSDFRWKSCQFIFHGDWIPQQHFWNSGSFSSHSIWNR